MHGIGDTFAPANNDRRIRIIGAERTIHAEVDHERRRQSAGNPVEIAIAESPERNPVQIEATIPRVDVGV